MAVLNILAELLFFGDSVCILCCIEDSDGKSRDTVSSRDSLKTVFHCLGFGLGLEGYCLGLRLGLECSVLVSCLVETFIKTVVT